MVCRYGEYAKIIREGKNLCQSEHLNENVLREIHPLPKGNGTLAQLSGAQTFYKLDTNSILVATFDNIPNPSVHSKNVRHTTRTSVCSTRIKLPS